MSRFVRLAAYVSPLRADEEPTGVGQHISGMFSALQQRDDVLFTLVTPRGRHKEARHLTGQHARSRIVATPWPDRPLRLATAWSSVVTLDRWLESTDWVYTPVEQPVTTRRALAVTIHDLYPFEVAIPGLAGKPAPSFSWRRRMTRILRRADLVATVSSFTKSRILDLFDVRHPDRIAVIGNGGAEGFSPTPRPEDEESLRRYELRPDRYVVVPASLTLRKGGDLLLDVARLAHGQRSDMSFAVIGKRHDLVLLRALGVLKERIPQLGIRLLGYIPKSDLAALYRHARAAFLPSRYEGFGIPVIEALASGCPLVITRQPALVEVAAGRAQIVDPDPSEALMALMQASRRGQQSGESDHTWARCAAKLIRAMANCPHIRS